MKNIKPQSLDKINKKRISYVFPTFNREKFVDKEFKELKKLLTSRDELIIIDGGSTDQTKKIVKKNSKLVNLFVSEKDINQIHATNKGLILAQGKYIKIINDDDYIDKQGMETAIAIMDNQPEIDLLVCGGIFKKIGSSKKERINYVPAGINYGKNYLDVVKYGGCGMGFVIRRSSLPKLGLFDISDWLADASYAANAMKKKFCVRFARINLYTAQIHNSNSFIRFASEVDRAWLKFYQNHATKSMFTRYWINRFIRKHQNLERILLPVNRLLKLIRQNQTKKLQSTKIIWDGGIS